MEWNFDNVKFNGKDLDRVQVDGVTVWEKNREVCLYDDEILIPNKRYDAVSLTINDSQGYDYYDCSINGDNSISGCTLTKIKLNIYNKGKISLTYWNSKPTAMGQGTIIQTWNVTQTGIQELTLDTPFVVQDGMYIGIGAASDTSKFRYNYNNSHTEGYGFYYNATRAARNATTNQLAGSLGVSYYGYQ